MSTLRTYNLQSIDSGSANIQLTPNAGAIFTGLTTAQSGLNVTGGAIVGGGLTVTGVLTYDDVTNIDSIGVVTARSGIHIGTGTSITSPSDNVLTLGTNNTEKLRITGIGSVGIGTDEPKTIFHISDNTVANARITISKFDAFRNNFIGLDDQSDELVIAADDDNQGNNSSLRLKVDGAAVGTFTGTGVSFAQDLTLPNQERFLAYKTGNQTETDNTSVVVGQAAAVYDTANGWDDLNNKYVVQNSGFFLLIANIAIVSSTSNELRDAAISIERSTDSGSNWTPIASSGMRASTISSIDTDGLTLHIVLPYNLNAGDWLRVGAYGNTHDANSWVIEDSINDIIGGDINLSGAAADYDDTATYFSVIKLA